jgi:hypothetical protein
MKQAEAFFVPLIMDMRGHALYCSLQDGLEAKAAELATLSCWSPGEDSTRWLKLAAQQLQASACCHCSGNG